MKTSPESSVVTKGAEPVNVLLAYDNSRTCAASLKMLDRISTRLHDQGLFNVNAFTFGLLERMDPFKWTSASANAAELVMVAFSKEGVPGARLLRWLENWAKNHSGQEAGLGLLPLGPQTARSVRRTVRALKKIAARHDVGFIYEANAGLNAV
jgi:hypothetical protein